METKIVELKITTNIPDASKQIETFKGNIDKTKRSTKDLKKETDSVNGGGFDKLSGSLSNVSPKFNSAISGAKAFGTQLLLLAANPLGAVIIAVVGSLTLLYKAFTSTKAGGEALEIVMAGIGAAVDVLRDRILNVGNAIIKFFSGDFKGALSEAKKSVSGIGSEIEKEFKQASDAKKYLQEVDDALRSLGVSRARLNRDLAKSKEIITDENASYAEKKKAINDVKIAEEKQTESELINAAKKLKAIKLANSLSDTGKEDLQKEATAQAELYALQEKSATDRRAIRKTELRADKEEQSRIKEIATKRNEIAKEQNEKRLAIDKEENERLRASGERSRQQYEDNEKLIADARKRNLDAEKSENQLKVEAEILDFETKKQRLIDANLSVEQIETEHKRKLAELNNQYYAGEADKSAKATADAQANAKKESDAEQAKFDLKLSLWNQTANALGGLSALFKKGTAAAKGAALAEVAIGTATGLINGLDIAQKSAKGTGPAAAFAFPLFYATQVAAVFGAVGKAKAILGSGGGNGAPSVSGGSSAPSAPNFNVVGTSGQNQIAQTLTREQPPVKAYVVAGEMTTQQSLDRNIVKSASVG